MIDARAMKCTSLYKYIYILSFSLSVDMSVCSVRVIGESDIMQEFLSESNEVGTVCMCKHK